MYQQLATPNPEELLKNAGVCSGPKNYVTPITGPAKTVPTVVKIASTAGSDVKINPLGSKRLITRAY